MQSLRFHSGLKGHPSRFLVNSVAKKRFQSTIPEQGTTTTAVKSGKSKSRFVFYTFTTTVLLGGAYLGGLYVSEKHPEVKKIYDELPFTEEVKKSLSFLLPERKKPIQLDSAKTSKKPIEKPVEKPVEKLEVEVPKVEEIIEEKVEEIIEDLVKHSEKNAKPKENVDQVVEEIEVIIVNPIETDIKGVDQSQLDEIESDLQDLMKQADDNLIATRATELREQITNLSSKLEQLVEEKRVIEEAYEAQIRRIQAQLQNDATMALAEIKYRHELELKELAAKYDGIVAAQYRAQENMYNLQLQQELLKQKDDLDALFEHEIELAIKKERLERGMRLEKLQTMSQVQEKIIHQQMSNYKEQELVREILLGYLKFESAIEKENGFETELNQLKTLAANLPLVSICLESIPTKLAQNKLHSLPDLAARFSTVKQSIVDSAYVSPNGGMWSFALSWVLAKVSFGKSGLIEGDDTLAIVSRAEHFLLQGNIEYATRELNQLKHWPRKIASDWINDARDYLLVHQALLAIEAEIAHKLLF